MLCLVQSLSNVSLKALTIEFCCYYFVPLKMGLIFILMLWMLLLKPCLDTQELTAKGRR